MLLPADTAAVLAIVTDLSEAMRLLFGLATRCAARAMFRLVAVIQTFVCPANWKNHILWETLLLSY